MSDLTATPTAPIIMHDAEQVQELLAQLTALAEAAVAERQLNDGSEPWCLNNFSVMFHQAIDHLDASGDTPNSVGLTWLSKPQGSMLFKQLVPESQRVAIFWAHLANRFIVDMVDNPHLLELMPQEERHAFAAAVLGTWIPQGDHWIFSLASNKVHKRVAPDAMKMWIRNPELFEGGDDFASRFLREGPGMAIKLAECDIVGPRWTLPQGTATHTLWSALESGDLYQLLSECAVRVPTVFFEAPAKNDIPVARKVFVRLRLRETERVLSKAASNLQSPENLSLDALNCLTKGTKRTLAQRLDGISVPFLVKLALDIPAGYALFGRYVARRAKASTDLVSDLLAARRIIHEFEAKSFLREHEEIILRMHEELRRLAADNNVITGTLEMLPNNMLGLTAAGYTYFDSTAERRDLQSGDRVIFRIPETGVEVEFIDY